MPTFKVLNSVLLFSIYAKMAHKVLAN